MSHSHLPMSNQTSTDVVGSRTKVVLLSFLAIIAALVTIGLIILWPNQQKLADVRGEFSFTAPGVSYEKAKITAVSPECETQQAEPGSQSAMTCLTVDARILTGPDIGEITQFEVVGAAAETGISVGDKLQVMRVPTETGAVNYSYAGVNRNLVTTVLLLVFVLAVLIVARWKGLFALLGLAASIGLLVTFILPGLAIGESGLLIGLVGSTAIIFVVIYIAHGFSIRTSTALAGTIIGLLISTGLGLAAVHLGRLSGYLDETEQSLKSFVPEMNIRELMVCAMVIAGLGVLNDVTITQTSAVWELRAAAPNLSRKEIFASGMRIGRDHIASTIYTIVFAYAGAALTTLVLVMLFNDRPLIELLAAENFGGEVLRTLASATGLVLTVPLTTAIAALAIKPGTGKTTQVRK